MEHAATPQAQIRPDPQPSSDRRALLLVFGGAACGSWLVCGLLTALLGLLFAQVFRDYGYVLPTRLASASLWFSTNWAAIALVVLAAIATTGTAIACRKLSVVVASLCVAWGGFLVIGLSLLLTFVWMINDLNSLG